LGATVWFLVAFGAVVVMIVLTVWSAMVLEAREPPPGHGQEAAEPGGAPGEANAPEKKAA
jgi:hypothetical protein